MTADDLAFAPAAELARLLAAREVSATELVELYLGRIERFDGSLRSYITVLADQAREDARAADAAAARGESLGMLHGLPIAVKDQFYTRGIRTTCGSAQLADHVVDVDAAVVSRVRDEGGILLGKLNMTEFALGGTVDFPFGQPRNPWNLDHDAGSSSTGAGIAVAAGLCAAAVGEDTGGSIRNPASMNGIVGLRPTWGRVSRHGMWPLVWSLDVAGPMTRRVEDAALLLGAISGHDPHDPFSARLPVPDYQAALGDDLRGARVGVIRENVQADFVDPQVRSAVLDAAQHMAGLGADVEEVSIPLLPLAGVVFVALCDGEGAVRHREGLATRPGDYDRAPRRRMLAASLLPTTLAYKVQQARNLIRDQVRAAAERYDVLLLVTTPSPPARIEAAQGIVQSKDDLVRLFERRSCTSPFPLAGTPAISLPCGFTAEGLPIGLQLAARTFGEAGLLKVAHAYEQSTPWHRRIPLSAGGGSST